MGEGFGLPSNLYKEMEKDMKTCMICNQPVASGFVVCGNCAGEIKSGEVPPDTLRFIGQLAVDIYSEEDAYPCTFCNNSCHGQENQFVCPNGIKSWLIDRAKKYFFLEKPGETSR